MNCMQFCHWELTIALEMNETSKASSKEGASTRGAASFRSTLLRLCVLSCAGRGAMASDDNVLARRDDSGELQSNKTAAAVQVSSSAAFRPLLLDNSRMTVMVCGYVTPAIVLLTVINNATSVICFCQFPFLGSRQETAGWEIKRLRNDPFRRSGGT